MTAPTRRPSLRLVMAGALAGFLVLNWHPAKVFLGDNGSYFVGAFVAYGIMRISPEPIDSRLAVASVLAGIFELDLAVTIIRHKLAGAPLLTGDRSHIYDQLRDRGTSERWVAVTMAAAELGFAAIAAGFEQVRSGPVRLVLDAVAVVASLLLARAGGFFSPRTDWQVHGDATSLAR